jgi:nitroreductase
MNYLFIYMNVFQALHSMSPTTEFLDKPVDERMIGLILHSATRAISAGNMQEWDFIVVEDDKTKEDLSRAALNLLHIKDAPSIIAVCVNLSKAASKYGKRGEVVYSVEDGAAATQIVAIAATALGLGYDIVRAFDEEQVKGYLNLPDDIRPVAIVPIGFPKHEIRQESKVNFEDLTHVNRYGNKIAVTFEPIITALEKNVKEMREKYKSSQDGQTSNIRKFIKKILKR